MSTAVKMYDNPEKLRTIDAAKKGDQDAFLALYNEHEQQITVICRGIAGTHFQDLVQIAFNKAFTRIHQFHYNSAFYTWLCRIAINESLMSIRGKKKRAQLDTECHELPDPNSEEHAHTDLALAGILDKIQIQRALVQLAPSIRRVVVLAYIEGYEYKEIANMLGTTEFAIRSRLSKARSVLRQYLTR